MKPKNEFGERENGYLRSWCRLCVAEHGRNSYRKNPEKRIASTKAWIEKNPEKVKASHIAWRKKNPDRVRILQRRHKYGISADSYNKLLMIQDSKCAICFKIFVSNPDIDHNHRTGQIRGLLCRSCNLMLGCSKEDIKVLRQAIHYLDKYTIRVARKV
jgi:hypothetical protein